MTPEFGFAFIAVDHSDRGNLDHIVGIVIDQLEPVFRDVGRGQNFVFQILRVISHLQVDLTDSFAEASDGTLTGSSAATQRLRWRV